ncbi:hybrid sensor histidine kinase/response regulator, partial [Pseudomonas syringae pv. actinidiae]|nr:hybrid sensor histidine kinase/response regulator [Pseudomonas syringae pv. actinidiae]
MSNDVSGGMPFAPQPLRPSAQEAAERLQLALDSGAVVGTWVWDVVADRLTGDERFARTFGLCPKLCAKGLPLELVTASIHPDDSLRVDKAIEEALLGGDTYR